MDGTLHGLWLGDAFFCYGLKEEQLLPPSEIERWLIAQAAEPIQGLKQKVVSLWLPDARQLGVSETKVEGIALPAARICEILLQRDVSVNNESQLHIGSDLQYWHTCAHFALSLAERTRISPGIDVYEQGNEYEMNEHASVTGSHFTGKGTWVPHLEATADREQFERLCQQMPPSCGAYLIDRGKGWHEAEPSHILHSFLSAALESWLREQITPAALRELNRRIRPRSHTEEAAAVPLQWWRALLSPAARAYLSVSVYELMKLEPLIRNWTHSNFTLPGKRRKVRNLKLGFRLDPPDLSAAHHEEAAWVLHFLLYPETEPSLLLPAAEIWKRRDKAEIMWQDRLFENAAEALISELTMAISYYGELATAIEQTSQPEQLNLSTAEAYDFLREVAPLFLARGHVVQLPSWWTDSTRTRLQPQLKLKVQSAPGNAVEPGARGGAGNGLFSGMKAWFTFDIQAALGDDEISPAQIREWAQRKETLIPFQGNWIELDAKAVERAAAWLEDQSFTQTINFKDLLYLHSEIDHDPSNRYDPRRRLPSMQMELPEAIASLLEGNWEQLSERLGKYHRPVSVRLQGALRPYQVRGFQWMALMRDLGFGICLADDMGLGKTIQVIALLLEQRLSEPALIVCPTSVLWNWQKEISRFAPDLQVLIHHGPLRCRDDSFAELASKYDVVLTSYPLVMRDEPQFHELEWSYFILDEAQHIKNHETKQARAVARLKTKAKVRIALTGTPMENRLTELWAILNFLNPGFLGDLATFQKSFVAPIERQQNTQRTKQLRKLVGPFIMRRLKTDPEISKDLPEKVESKAYCTLTAEQAALYQTIIERMMTQIEGASGIQRRGRIMAGLTHLKQVCNHPVLYLKDGSKLRGRSGKVKRILELLQAVRDAGEAALIFTQYAQMGHLLVRLFEEQWNETPLFLHGQIPVAKREEMITSFQAEEGSPMFILSLKAGGVGLNLTRANHVIHFDRWWNPAVEEQATDRAFRIGQKRNVQVHKLVTRGTLEERIDDMLEAKKHLLDAVVGSGEQWLTELSDEELRSWLELA